MMKTVKKWIRSVKSKMLLRLWGVMMLLVVLVLVFLWFVQIQFFEPNYMNATISQLSTQAGSVAEEVEALNSFAAKAKDNPLYLLSKTVNGKVFLVGEDGKILYAYSRMLITNDHELQNDEKGLQDKYHIVFSKGSLGEIIKYPEGSSKIYVGVPLEFEGKPAALILYNSVTELEALMELNRQQLLILSVLLTAAASVFSYLLARSFTKPVKNIEETVKQLATGDFTAVPSVKRGDELGQLSQSVEALSHELQRIDVLRKEVIANVSHELRAPLALISGYSEMVRDVTGPDETKRNQNMDLIIRESRRLSEMVDDIMDYSQLQAGYSELKLELCDPLELAEGSVQYAREAAKQYGIAVSLKHDKELSAVRMDALKMSQVMRNLLNNAINHTESGGTITVEVCQKQGVTVSVTNPGEPIPSEEAGIIWERYSRRQHQGERKEGTGIGLAIVRTILESHGFGYGVRSGGHENSFWFSTEKQARQGAK